MKTKCQNSVAMFCLLVLARCAAADVSLSDVGCALYDRYGMPKSMSGLTYAGGSDYYTIAEARNATGNVESWCLYKMTIKTSADGKTIEDVKVENDGVQLGDCTDLEAVAYDPASGNVWAADETKKTIGEYDPETGKALRQVEFPAFLKNNVSGYWFEGLTISGDGLTMWAANEEALVCDDTRSSYAKGTTVRLVKFTRASVVDNWTCVAMYPYKTAHWQNEYSYGTAGRHGVSELVALPDGSLLVLERELSATRDGTDIWAGLSVNLYLFVYRITPEAFAAATNVKDIESLKQTTAWVPVDKQSLWSNSGKSVGWANYEGCCLGPRISDSQCSLIALSDAGDSSMLDAKIKPFVLGGLNVRTLDFATPVSGRSSAVGNTYRYVDGAQVNVSLTGTVSKEPYAADGTPLADCRGWTAVGQSPASGSGETASFIVSSDGTFAWNVQKEIVANGYHVADSFEGFASGTVVSTLGGWRGDESEVETRTYAPPTPPGYVMTRESHTNVLDVVNGVAVKSVDAETFDSDRIDVMLCFVRPEGELEDAWDGERIRLAAGPDGCLYLWHVYLENGVWRKGWTRLSDRVYQDGTWFRLEVEFDRVGGSGEDAVARIRIDGSCLPTAHGVRSPADPKPYGAWYRLVKNGSDSASAKSGELMFVGTKVDDLMVCQKSKVKPEHTGDTAVDGIAFSWFDKAGLPRNPKFAAPFIPGYTLADVYQTGVDPYSDRPFVVTGFYLDANGRPHLEFNGYKGDVPVGYRVMYSPTPDFKGASLIDASDDGSFAGHVATWSTTWDGNVRVSSDVGFYRVDPISVQEVSQK